MKQYFFTTFLYLFALQFVLAQAVNPPIYLNKTTEKIILDGQLDEAAWFKGTPAKDFYQNFPSDSINAKGQTEIYMTYNDDFLYVGIKCHSTGEAYITPSLKRDYSFRGNDNVSILLDTYYDKLNAFLFGINPFGVRREALISNGGQQRGDFAASWDNKWFGEAKIHGSYWIAEMAIPFKTLRFKEGSTKWRFNCYRNDTQINERTTWTQIPRNQIIMDLGYMGDMVWDKPLEKTGTNISVIPYAIANVNRDYEDVTERESQWDFNFGGDAKIAITSGLNLDLTVNPDFSQVEVDQQVTNLSRFEVFFPERRQFFLENADLFGSFGLGRVNPFFSRRIGVAVDTATGQNFQNPILYGARLSGKLNKGLRVGLLNMQTAAEEENGLPSFNYTVAAVQQNVFSRSNLSFIFVNKQALNPDQFGGVFNDFNRVAGLEYRLGTANNRWRGKTFYHQVFSPDDTPEKFTHGFQLEYRVRQYRVEWAHLWVGQGFDAEVGFVPRKDFLLLSPEATWFIYPQKGKINQHSIGFDYREIYSLGNDPDNLIIDRFDLADRQLEFQWEMQFKDNTRLEINTNYNNIILLDDFDPTRIQADSINLLAGTRYNYTNFSLSYMSDPRKKFAFFATPTIGQFYNGFRAGVRGRLTYRYQPYGSVAIDYNYNYIKLDAPFVPANLWLVGPRIDLTFSKTLFLTTFFQYNSQLDNLNINARFQWRFQPVSDFFLVYTDNYLTDPFSQFGVRNRAIVAKVTYWLNL